MIDLQSNTYLFTNTEIGVTWKQSQKNRVGVCFQGVQYFCTLEGATDDGCLDCVIRIMYHIIRTNKDFDFGPDWPV